MKHSDKAEKSYFRKYVKSLPIHKRIWWEIWHRRLYWWLIKSWAWIKDEPWWIFPKGGGEPYLETLRTKKRGEYDER